MTWTGRAARAARIGAVAVALVAATVVAGPGTAAAAGNPYEKGPAPTEATFTNANGPFFTSKSSIGTGNGFGGGTVYYPTFTQGTFGAVVISPGFVEFGNANSWFGPRLASQGFVVLVMDSIGLFDLPEARGTQMLAALDYLSTKSSVKGLIDPQRLAVMGHSMGGGGSLDASITRPALQAAIPMEPFETGKTFAADTVPTLIIGTKDSSMGSPRSAATCRLTACHRAPGRPGRSPAAAGRSRSVSISSSWSGGSPTWSTGRASCTGSTTATCGWRRCRSR